MSDLKIRTNNVPRPLLQGYEIPESELADQFDYLSEQEQEDRRFFKYQGIYYSLDQFMKYTAEEGPFKGWEASAGDSPFSGVLIRFPRDEWNCIESDQIICGYYTS